MIIVTLLGGLGNQMFQYALGRALSIRLNTELVVDLTSYGLDPLRSYQLPYFPIHARISSHEDQSKVVPSEGMIKKIKARIGLIIRNENPIIVIKERSLRYDPAILQTPDNSSLYGYWQCEQYFSDISDIIRTDFSFPAKISLQNDTCLKKIEKTTSVSIHIRHGDYISNPTTNAYHGVCSKEYYYNAMSLVEEQIKEPEYFIFTDDPQWAKNNIITTKSKTIVDWNDNSPHEDMRLMASCRHHIIANSSFSWWGAWLGKTKNQIVIAPEPWYDAKEQDTRDIYSDDWIRLEKNNPLI